MDRVVRNGQIFGRPARNSIKGERQSEFKVWIRLRQSTSVLKIAWFYILSSRTENGLVLTTKIKSSLVLTTKIKSSLVLTTKIKSSLVLSTKIKMAY